METIQVIGGQRRIELAGAAPDLEVGLLHDLLGEVLPTQDTQENAVQFRPGSRVEPLEGGAIGLRDRRQQPHQLLRTQHMVERPAASMGRLSTAGARASSPQAAQIGEPDGRSDLKQ
jgi:hypothetical protein